MMKRLFTILLMATAIALPVSASANQSTSSSSQTIAQSSKSAIQSRLDRAGVKYEVMQDGSFRVGLRLKGNRTQLAIIRPEVRKIGNTAIVDVVSFAYMAKAPLSTEQMNQLLEDNVSYPLGSWGATKLDDGRYSVFYLSKIALNDDNEFFKSGIYETMSIADAMEKTLTNQDAL